MPRYPVPSLIQLGNKTKCRLFICTGCLTKGSSSAPGLLVGPETGADSNKLVRSLAQGDQARFDWDSEGENLLTGVSFREKRINQLRT